MTPLEMSASAARAMAEPGTVGVVLTIAKGGMPKGFPRGELLNEMERNGRVERTYSFNPEKVLAWLIHNGLIEMERTNDTTLSFKVPNVEVSGLAPLAAEGPLDCRVGPRTREE